MKQRHLGKTALWLFAVSGVVAIAWALRRQDSSLRQYQAGRPLRIGYATEAPFAFLTADGEVTGESPEVAKRVAAELGIPNIVWRNMEFGALIDELEAGNIDVIAAGLFVTPERARRVAFSAATFRVRSGLLVAKGNPKRLHSCRQTAEEPSVRLAVLAGSVEESLYRQLGFPSERLTVAPDALTALAAIGAGVADALALSSPSVNWMADHDQAGRTEAAHPFEPTPEQEPGCGAFAFRTGDRALLRAWNAALRGYLRSAGHLSLITRFGFTSADLPDVPSRAEEPSQ